MDHTPLIHKARAGGAVIVALIEERFGVPAAGLSKVPIVLSQVKRVKMNRGARRSVLGSATPTFKSCGPMRLRHHWIFALARLDQPRDHFQCCGLV